MWRNTQHPTTATSRPRRYTNLEHRVRWQHSPPSPDSGTSPRAYRPPQTSGWATREPVACVFCVQVLASLRSCIGPSHWHGHSHHLGRATAAPLRRALPRHTDGRAAFKGLSSLRLPPRVRQAHARRRGVDNRRRWIVVVVLVGVGVEPPGRGGCRRLEPVGLVRRRRPAPESSDEAGALRT